MGDGFNHREAYSLLTYRGDCGIEETLWNAGDHEPLFIVPCRCGDRRCMARHVDWKLDARKVDFVAPAGMRGFRAVGERTVLVTYEVQRQERVCTKS